MKINKNPYTWKKLASKFNIYLTFFLDFCHLQNIQSNIYKTVWKIFQFKIVSNVRDLRVKFEIY